MRKPAPRYRALGALLCSSEAAGPLTLLAGFAASGVGGVWLGGHAEVTLRGWFFTCQGVPPRVRESSLSIACCRRPRGLLLAWGCLRRVEGAAEDRAQQQCDSFRVWEPHVAAWGRGAALWVCAHLSGFCSGPSPASLRSASPCSCVSAIGDSVSSQGPPSAECWLRVDPPLFPFCCEPSGLHPVCGSSSHLTVRCLCGNRSS